MSEFLHVHHDDNLHEVSYMQAVSCRVEADVELYLFVLQQFTDLILVSTLFYKSSFLQDIVNVVMLAYGIRY